MNLLEIIKLIGVFSVIYVFFIFYVLALLQITDTFVIYSLSIAFVIACSYLIFMGVENIVEERK